MLFHPIGWVGVFAAGVILVLVAGGEGPLAWLGFGVVAAARLPRGAAEFSRAMTPPAYLGEPGPRLIATLLTANHVLP